MGVRFSFFRLILLAAVIVIAGLAFGDSPRAASREFDSVSDEGALQPAPVLEIAGGAAAGEGAKNFVQNMAGRAIGFLGDASMGMDKKKSAFRTLLQDSFDMKTIGRFALGRYWRTATPEQRKQYQALFEKMVINVYSARFSEYKGQKFEARSFRAEGENDTLVTSFIIPSDGPEIQVDWRVRYKNGSYKIVDVMVEGVSMSVTQRSDFSAVIQRGGGNVQVLIDHLKAQ